jgi:tripartite-type tricarboxylate transporter receptor subunit TctC
MVVPYVPGGIVDLIGRLTGPGLAERLGQNVIIENISGASGTLGAAKVAGARPDGYTLLIGSGAEVSLAELVTPSIRYDGERDLAPISLIGSTPMVLLGGARLKGAETLADVLALARAKPGQYAYASSGVGSPNHLAGEAIKLLAHVDITHVPYKGAGQTIPDLIGGHIDLSVLTLSSAIPHIKAGKIKAYGVTEAKRSPIAPNIPALAENKEFSGLDMSIWWALFAPAKTPPAILERLEREYVGVLKEPRVVAKLKEQAVSIRATGPAELRAFVREDTEKYRKVVQWANIRAE